MGVFVSALVLSMLTEKRRFTARTRRSAVKARKSISAGSSSKAKFISHSEPASLEIVENTLRMLKRHRKQRHAKLRDMTREEEEENSLTRVTAEGTVCPVCLKVVPGDADVVEAHVDSCLAHEARLREERERAMESRTLNDAADGWEEVEVDGETRIRVTDGATLQGKL